MNTGNGFSFSVSLLVHFALLLSLLYLKFEPPLPADNLIEIGFGGGYGDGGGGTEFVTPQLPGNETNEATAPEDNTTLPESKQPADDAMAKNKTGNSPASGNNGNNNTKGLGPGDGPGNGGDGTGFFFDWGGGGRRKIYQYVIPEYPSGVNKEIDIRLRFTILPDGSVGTILPLTKADARLENSAVNSLRQWRFEPLPKSMAQMEQVAVITFPFRLQ